MLPRARTHGMGEKQRKQPKCEENRGNIIYLKYSIGYSRCKDFTMIFLYFYSCGCMPEKEGDKTPVNRILCGRARRYSVLACFGSEWEETEKEPLSGLFGLAASRVYPVPGACPSRAACR